MKKWQKDQEWLQRRLREKAKAFKEARRLGEVEKQLEDELRRERVETRPDAELERIQTRYYHEFPDPVAMAWDKHDNRGDRASVAWVAKFKAECESRLYIFAKYVLGMKDLDPELHGGVCDWLQDMDPRHEHRLTPSLKVRGSRWKLLMLPVVHLKTSIGSHAFPLHALIQPLGRNIYFEEMSGADTRILLHGETTAKAKENLGFIRQHLEHNSVLRWMWPELMWREKKEAPLWSDDAITVKRTGAKILAEPTITAIGVGTGLEQRHYDIVIMDDLATFEAAQSELVMERARARRKACRSRLNDLVTSIELGIGTHWTPLDIYTDWRKDPDVEVCIRSAIENEQPIWPKRHPLDKLLALQAEEGMGKVLFSANYMNNPLNSAFTALDWGEVRMFEYDAEKQMLAFEESEVDAILFQRNNLSGLLNANQYALYKKPIRGVSIDQFYHRLRDQGEEDPKELHERRIARMKRMEMAEDEGSATRIRMEQFRHRREEEWKKNHGA